VEGILSFNEDSYNIIKNYGSDPSLRSCLHRKLFIDEHENQRDLVKTDHI